MVESGSKRMTMNLTARPTFRDRHAGKKTEIGNKRSFELNVTRRLSVLGYKKQCRGIHLLVGHLSTRDFDVGLGTGKET